MKKTNRIITAAVIALSLMTRANDHTGHTFFAGRPPFLDVMPEKMSLFRDRMFVRKDGIMSALQVVPFGSKSINDNEIARFFMPFNKSQLVTGEFGSTVVQDGTVDVMANYFGVLTRPTSEVFADTGFDTRNLTFQSTIKFRPVQSIFGLGLTYQQKISRDALKGWWCFVSAPLMHVKNDLGFTETIINRGGGEVPEGYVGSIREALEGETIFGNKRFCYGKIDTCGRSKWGVAELEVAFGYEDRSDEICHKMWYVGISIPTGNKPKGEYVFEPIVGNNKHVAFVFGSGYYHEMWSNHVDQKLWVYFNAQSRYLFENKQKRSVDLLDKQWSRYMWVCNTEMNPVPEGKTPLDFFEPGINYLTLDVKVSPRSSINLNTGVTYTWKGFIAEFDYNAYGRQSEKVSPDCPFENGPGIASFNFDATEGTYSTITKSNANIRRFLESGGGLGQGIQNDTKLDDAKNTVPAFIRIKEADINFASAAHPATLSYIFALTLGYKWAECEFPVFVSGGSSYEFSADNAGFERWTIWAKGGISF